MTRPGACVTVALLAAALLATGEVARAEIYKCRGANGETVYTSDASQCPGAAAHETTGRVHTVEGAPSRAEDAPDAAPPGPAAAIDDDAARAAVWREKKAQTRRALADAERRLESLDKAVTWCNRGYALYREDDSGIRRDVDCRDVHRRFEELQGLRTELRAYLDGGLEEECRRAGCLPGWIRD